MLETRLDIFNSLLRQYNMDIVLLPLLMEPCAVVKQLFPWIKYMFFSKKSSSRPRNKSFLIFGHILLLKFLLANYVTRFFIRNQAQGPVIEVSEFFATFASKIS